MEGAHRNDFKDTSHHTTHNLAIKYLEANDTAIRRLEISGEFFPEDFSESQRSFLPSFNSNL